MAEVSAIKGAAQPAKQRTRKKRSLASRLLVAGTILFLTLFVILPVANVFTEALSKGVGAYVETFYVEKPAQNANLSFRERHRIVAKAARAERTWSAIRLSCFVAACVVPLNMIFGLAAAWAIAKFRFRGRVFLLTLIDLPFSISPVIAGMMFVLLFGRTGIFGDWATNLTWPDPTSIAWQGFEGHWWPFAFTRSESGIMFTPLAIILATIFVTFPFVARSVIPLMEAQGSEEEIAALSLGAGGWRTFRTVTLANIKWALLYGAILCTARTFGEFGAVSVVSGHIDSNDTMPLRIEKLWDAYDMQAAFSVATLLSGLAVLTLIVKSVVEWKTGHTRAPEPRELELKSDEHRSAGDQQVLRLLPGTQGREP
ncbi:MAG TPA: ABC transporter permease subunit [Methylovirgula sp.]|nr:ABC transporter permease subunit [Methylovirgula sp.]